LFHDIRSSIHRTTTGQRLRATPITRLALLVTGIMTARRCVLLEVAADLDGVALTDAREGSSSACRLRRIVADPHLTAMTCSPPCCSASSRGRRCGCYS